MISRRNAMRQRVATKFARVPGQHGDHHPSMMYPFATTPGLFGGPWAKVKALVVPFLAIYAGMMFPFFALSYSGLLTTMFRLLPGNWGGQTRGIDMSNLAYADLDVPDWKIKHEAFENEKETGLTNIRHGGINYLASFMWQPGDPEPDLRLRLPPGGALAH